MISCSVKITKPGDTLFTASIGDIGPVAGATIPIALRGLADAIEQAGSSQVSNDTWNNLSGEGQ